MREHFQETLRAIGGRLAAQAGTVDVAIDRAVAAFLTQDARDAGQVVDSDLALDRAEVELERTCLDVIAMQQPMAKDLRYLAGAMKINGDLERMGDLACNVAKQTWRISQPPPEEFAQRLAQFCTDVRAMVSGAIDALVGEDAALAREVWASDVRADHHLRMLLELSMTLLKGERVTPEDTACLIAAARNLERIGDHAQNIAENVVFIVEGDIVRHNVEARISPPMPEGV